MFIVQHLMDICLQTLLHIFQRLIQNLKIIQKTFLQGARKKKHSDQFFSAKIKYGAQAPDMVKPTFFLWEITQKFFFLAYGFHILATQKTIFMVLGGPNGASGPFGSFQGLKRAIFGQFSIKFKVLNLLKICLYSKTIKRHIRIF